MLELLERLVRRVPREMWELLDPQVNKALKE